MLTRSLNLLRLLILDKFPVALSLGAGQFRERTEGGGIIDAGKALVIQSGISARPLPSSDTSLNPITSPRRENSRTCIPLGHRSTTTTFFLLLFLSLRVSLVDRKQIGPHRSDAVRVHRKEKKKENRQFKNTKEREGEYRVEGHLAGTPPMARHSAIFTRGLLGVLCYS